MSGLGQNADFNNVRGNFGPPKWEDCLINFTTKNQIISINLRGL